MLFRRVKEHVAKEDWFAVLVDFVIVVLGVFIGFQVTNWNDNRADQQEYKLAIERYKMEAQSNIHTLEQSDEGFQKIFNMVPEAIEVLRRCEDTPENLELVENGLNRLRGTWGIQLNTQALTELNSSAELLAQQTPKMRQLFAATEFKVNLLLKEARYIEDLPLSIRVETNPMIKLGPVSTRPLSYNGIDFTRKSRRLELGVPLTEACENTELLAAFYTWEKWQGTLPMISLRLRSEIEMSLEQLGE